MYRLYPPCPPLRPYIDNYWLLRASIPAHAPLTEAVFVDGKADILFNFGAAYQRAGDAAGARIVARSNVDGQRLTPIQITQTGEVHLIGVRFRAGGLSPFLAMPAHELSGEVVEVEAVFGAAARTLEDELYDLARYPERQVERLNRFLMARLQPSAVHDLVGAMIARLTDRAPRSIGDLSAEFGYSVRSVDRFFRQVTGFAPRQYLRIIRLGDALHMLCSESDLSLTELALRAGYYDHAHFTHDFKAFTGHTPSAYRVMLSQRRTAHPPNLVQFLQDAPRPDADN